MVETFEEKISYKTIDLGIKSHKTLSSIKFSSLSIATTSVFEENVAIAFTSGEILILKIFANKLINHFFMASEKAITFVKFLFKGNWLIYGDSDGNCMLLYLENFQLKKYKKKHKSIKKLASTFSADEDEGEIRPFKVHWDDPENIQSGQNEELSKDSKVFNDSSVPVKVTGILEDPSLYGDKNILYIFDKEGRIHCLELPELIDDLITGYELDEIENDDKSNVKTLTSNFRRTKKTTKKKTVWRMRDRKSRQVLPSGDSVSSFDFLENTEKSNCLSYLRTHTVRK